jgi:tellurium resistance protein TerD
LNEKFLQDDFQRNGNNQTDIQKLAFTVTIHEFDKRKQNFGMISNSFIRIVNEDCYEEEARFD